MNDLATPSAGTTPGAAPPGVIVAALKWADLFFDVDPFTGEASADPKARGFSAADEAALELALRLGEAFERSVVAISVGGPDATVGLQRSLAVGASRGVHVNLEDPNPSSLNVAAALAWGMERAALVAPLIVCGDYSADRGSGSVPAALAALLGLPQALGLVSASLVEALDQPGGDDDAVVGRVRVQRRLDGARREELLVAPPAVLSVEGAVARLRRAPLSGALGVDQAKPERWSVPTEVVAGPSAGVGEVGPPTPRTKVMPAPAGGGALTRVEQLTGLSSTATSPAQALVVSPEEAAEHLLTAWIASGGTVPEGFVPEGAIPGVAPSGTDHPEREGADRPVIEDPNSPRPGADAPAAHPDG